MPFSSILFEQAEQPANVDERQPPECFRDLNLDQVVEAITAGRQEYRLEPFFYAPLPTLQAIGYRHEVFRDLEQPELRERIAHFGGRMRAMREHLAQAAKLYYRLQRESWFLDAVGIYVDAVGALQRELSASDVSSRGLRAFGAFLSAYVRSAAFTSLAAETTRLQQELSAVTYCLHIRGTSITVSRYDSQPDYAAEVEATFHKFRRGDVGDYRASFSDWVEMNHVEAGVLDRVALLYPQLFATLDHFFERHQDYVDPTLARFDREVQLYLAYLEFAARLQAAGLPFCYPRVSDRSKEVCARDTFDVALASKLVPARLPLVCNDFALQDPERIVVVTGPNQGGKTTFARTFGQLHYLASLGCPVPGREARLFLCDALLTHFERQEDLDNLRGKLEDDLVRMHAILSRATSRSIVIMNEIFTSTTFRDALFLGRKVLERLGRLDVLGVCVTFVDELASLGETTVSMTSTVAPHDPAVRTFKIVRRPADGRAYAVAIAEKYGLTYERLRERLDP